MCLTPAASVDMGGSLVGKDVWLPAPAWRLRGMDAVDLGPGWANLGNQYPCDSWV